MPFVHIRRQFVVLGILLFGIGIAQAAPTTSRLDREKYWADQIVDNVMVGEATWLSNRGHKFLALYAAPEKPSTTAVVLIHGRGVHPAWGFIGKLYRDLNDAGHHTLSVQVPILNTEAKFSDYGPTFPEAFERIDAGLRYLRNRAPHVKHIFLFGHSSGGMTVVAYAAKRPIAGLAGVAASGLSTLSGGPDVMQPALMLKTIRMPVLDIYGSNDLEEVLSFTKARQQGASEAGNARYRAIRIKDADHFLSDHYPELLKLLRDWMAQAVPASPADPKP